MSIDGAEALVTGAHTPDTGGGAPLTRVKAAMILLHGRGTGAESLLALADVPRSLSRDVDAQRLKYRMSSITIVGSRARSAPTAFRLPEMSSTRQDP